MTQRQAFFIKSIDYSISTSDEHHHQQQKIRTIWLCEREKTTERTNMTEHGNCNNPFNIPG